MLTNLSLKDQNYCASTSFYIKSIFFFAKTISDKHIETYVYLMPLIFKPPDIESLRFYETNLF